MRYNIVHFVFQAQQVSIKTLDQVSERPEPPASMHSKWLEDYLKKDEAIYQRPDNTPSSEDELAAKSKILYDENAEIDNTKDRQTPE